MHENVHFSRISCCYINCVVVDVSQLTYILYQALLESLAFFIVGLNHEQGFVTYPTVISIRTRYVTSSRLLLLFVRFYRLPLSQSRSAKKKGARGWLTNPTDDLERSPESACNQTAGGRREPGQDHRDDEPTSSYQCHQVFRNCSCLYDWQI